MIYETLEILMDQVSQFLATKSNDDSILVLENIAKQDNVTAIKLKDRVVLTLLNMEEEVALKNMPNKTFKDGKIIYRNNKINLNLYVLFSANRTAYDKALVSISNIVEFFQSKKVFTQVDTPLNASGSIFDELKEFKFIVELYTPTFEQLNYIWGALGGKSVPNVLYRISIVEIESKKINNVKTPITSIGGVFKNDIL